MNYSKTRVIVVLIFIGVQSILLSQQNKTQKDTILPYLKKTAIKLLQPHSDMTFAFGTEELKNEIPDLNIEIPELKDTLKHLEGLKGNYDDWHIFYDIGNLYARLGKEKNALDYYTNAYNLITAEIKKDSLNSTYFSDMGNLYMKINNNQYAFAYYKMAYELNPNDTAALNILPMFYIFSGDSKNAQTIIDKNLKKDPKHLNSYIWLVTQTVMGKFKEEIKPEDILNKKVEDIFDLTPVKTASQNYKKDPRFPVLYNLSKLLAMFVKYAMISDDMKKVELTENDNKELKKMQKFLNKAIAGKKFKNKYILYKALGFSYIFQKNAPKAIENFQTAMNLWPKNKLAKDYYILFSTHYFLTNDTLKALATINEKIEQYKKMKLSSANDYIVKANVLLNMKNMPKAQKAYEEALQLNLKAKDAYLGLAVLELLQNKLLESNKYLNKAYDFDKEYYMTYALFGIITLMADDKEKAKGALEKAMELKPDNDEIKEIYEAFF